MIRISNCKWKQSIRLEQNESFDNLSMGHSSENILKEFHPIVNEN